MKKIISTMAVATFVACAFTSCNNQPQQNDTKAATNAEAPKAEQKIAYVEVDSIMSQYTYWKDVTKLMQQKEQNIQKESLDKSNGIWASSDFCLEV